jgi:hypothetical protein
MTHALCYLRCLLFEFSARATLKGNSANRMNGENDRATLCLRCFLFNFVSRLTLRVPC